MLRKKHFLTIAAVLVILCVAGTGCLRDTGTAESLVKQCHCRVDITEIFQN